MLVHVQPVDRWDWVGPLRDEIQHLPLVVHADPAQRELIHIRGGAATATARRGHRDGARCRSLTDLGQECCAIGGRAEFLHSVVVAVDHLPNRILSSLDQRIERMQALRVRTDATNARRSAWNGVLPSSSGSITDAPASTK